MNLGCFPYRFCEGNYFLVAQTCIICGLMYELECKYFSEYKKLRGKNKSLLFITTNRTDILQIELESSAANVRTVWDMRLSRLSVLLFNITN